MDSLKFLTIALLTLCLLTGAALAQEDDTTTYAPASTLLSIDYPADWVLQEIEGGVLLTNAEALQPGAPEPGSFIIGLVEIAVADDATAESTLTASLPPDVPFGEPETLTVADHDAALAVADNETASALLLVVMLEDRAAVFSGIGASGEGDTVLRDGVLTVAETVSVGELEPLQLEVEGYTQTYTDDAITFNYPEGYSVEVDESIGQIVLLSEGDLPTQDIRISTAAVNPTAVPQSAPLTQINNFAQVMIVAGEELYDGSAIDRFLLNDRPAASIAGADDTVSGAVVSVLVNDDTVALLVGLGEAEERTPLLQTALAIASTLDVPEAETE